MDGHVNFVNSDIQINGNHVKYWICLKIIFRVTVEDQWQQDDQEYCFSNSSLTNYWNLAPFCTTIFDSRGVWKMQNLDLGPTHKTGGAKHKTSDFWFLKFFILMKFDPSQAPKNFFSWFQLCGISLDMF